MEASRLIGVFIIVVVLGLLFLCVRLSRTTTESRGGARDGSGWGPGFDSRRAPAIQRTSSASKYPRGRVTLSATQVLFGGGEALRLPTSKVLEVATEAIATLHDMCTTSELHLITQTDDDEVETAVMAALERASVFEHGMHRRRVLFCSTAPGRASIVRQLEPSLHLEDNADVVASLERFIPSVKRVGPAAPLQAAWAETAAAPLKPVKKQQ